MKKRNSLPMGGSIHAEIVRAEGIARDAFGFPDVEDAVGTELGHAHFRVGKHLVGAGVEEQGQRLAFAVAVLFGDPADDFFLVVEDVGRKAGHGERTSRKRRAARAASVFIAYWSLSRWGSKRRRASSSV